MESASRGGSESGMIDRTREHAIAEEIANEIHLVLGPVMPERLGEHPDAVQGVFGDAFDRHGVVDEASAARILARVPKELAARNLQFAELNRQIDVAVAATVNSGRETKQTGELEYDART